MTQGFKLLDNDDWPNDGGLWEITNIEFGHKTNWCLHIELERDGRIAKVVFSDAVSFRVQDEGEMTSYWSARSEEQIGVGTLYSIERSNYLYEFRNSASGSAQSIVHFLVSGLDICVEALAREPPVLTIRSAASLPA
ncbi:hypothetical protein [Mesorhizobium sp. URHB0026]